MEYTGNLKTDLLRVVRAYQESAGQHGQFIFTILAEITHYPELVTLLEAPLNVFSGVSQLLRRYQATGQLKPENPMHTLAALLGPLMIASMLHKTLGEQLIPPLNLEQHVSLFLAGRSV